MARFGSDAYEIDVGVTAGANVAELVSTFYVPAPYHCGGVGRLQSLGTTLVYKETLLFGTVASCIGAGTATLSPVSAASLDYTWTLSGKQDHHGTLIRRDSGGAPVVPAAAVGLWHGTLGTRELYIVVAPAGIGGTLAHELWVGDKCGATLTLTKVDGADLFATEQITSTGTSCPTGGSMTLTPLTAATLNATWRAPGRAFSATLARAR
jgi:hypothetical protein